MAAQSQQRVNLEDDRANYILASVITVLVLAIISTSLRLIARHLQKISFNASDYVAVVALVCGICEGAIIFTGLAHPASANFSSHLLTNYQATRYGFGRHVQTVSSPDLEMFLKLFFAAEIFYVLTITFAKFSVLLLYCSLFPDKRFALYAKIIAGVVLAWATACIFAVIFSCVPVQGFWDLEVKMHSTCIDSTKFFIGNAIPNMVTDVAILLLPMRKIWDLHMSARNKIVVSGIFLMGGFVIVASILRLALLFNEDLTDATYGLVNAFTWSNIEVDVAVLCASLPTLRPIFQKIWHPPSLSKFSRRSEKESQRSDKFNEAFAMPHIEHSARKNFQPLNDANGTYMTSVMSERDLEQDGEDLGGIRVERKIQNKFEST